MNSMKKGETDLDFTCQLVGVLSLRYHAITEMANQHGLYLLTLFKCIGLGVTNCIGIVQQPYTQGRQLRLQLAFFHTKQGSLLREMGTFGFIPLVTLLKYWFSK